MLARAVVSNVLNQGEKPMDAQKNELKLHSSRAVKQWPPQVSRSLPPFF